MSKKLLFFFVSLFCFTLEANEFLVEAKAGYFYPTDPVFRDIYGNGNGIYGVEFTGQICNCIYGWGSLNYFDKEGHSSLGDPTRIQITPLALGLKYFYSINCWLRAYAGLGALGTYLHIHDVSPFVLPKVHKWGFGGIVKSGVLIFVTPRWFIDIFADWSYMKIDFSNPHHREVIRRDADLSGFSAGAGVGFRF